MALQDKYKQLLDQATASGVTKLHFIEKEGVLYIDGEAPSGAVKDSLWDTYNKIDPNFLTGDVVMNVNVAAAAPGSKAKVTTEKSNLNIRRGPGTDQPVIGKAPHHSIVTLVNKTNDQWWLIRTDSGEEGYAYAQYLTPEA
jgi:uncharacterized protein YgiM (DUF1202 family)